MPSDAGSEGDSPQKKGDRNEREAANILSRVYGAGVDKVDRYGTNDPLGMVDVLAVKPGRKVLFVQVKTNRFTAEARRKYKKTARRKLPDAHAVFEVWVRVDYEGWRMYRYDPESEEFDQYLEMDTCDYEETVEAFREAVGFYDGKEARTLAG